jgi:hypothetical protein
MSSPETNVVDQREFWEARVNSYIQRFEYGADGRDTFVGNMMRMGYERDDVEDLLDEEDEDLDDWVD